MRHVIKRLDDGRYYKNTGGFSYRWVRDLRSATKFRERLETLREAVAVEINTPCGWRRTRVK
jgi:hypothetical protein